MNLGDLFVRPELLWGLLAAPLLAAGTTWLRQRHLRRVRATFGAGFERARLRPSSIRARAGTAGVLAGLLVGFGTRLGNGCTSGHGVCGISRLSRRSIVATVTFMATAAATVFVMRHLLGGGA